MEEVSLTSEFLYQDVAQVTSGIVCVSLDSIMEDKDNGF